MNLLEHEGKDILSGLGIAVPRGGVALNPEQAAEIASQLNCELMVKAQVRTGGRGRNGGVMTASSAAEARRAAERMLDTQISGFPVEAILVEERVWPDRELYTGVTVDRARRSAAALLSSCGGIDVESSGLVPSRVFDGVGPLWRHRFVGLGREAGLEGELLNRVTEVMLLLTRCFWEMDATTAEINPLAVTRGGEVMALDAKFVVDDAARFRQKSLAAGGGAVPSTEEKAARESGLHYVPLPGGNVGIIAGGAGLAMATMDAVYALGERPATFVDLGGGVTADRTASALRIVAASSGVEGIIINVFGGINNCEVMARGIVEVLRSEGLRQPLMVKMRGFSQDAGWSLLAEEGVPVVKLGTTGEAAAGLLKLMKPGR